MIELEVKLGSKTGLETVQNGEHAVVEVAPYDGSIQAPLVRVTPVAPACFQITLKYKILFNPPSPP